jgi:phosphomevalonate kinase
MCELVTYNEYKGSEKYKMFEITIRYRDRLYTAKVKRNNFTNEQTIYYKDNKLPPEDYSHYDFSDDEYVEFAKNKLVKYLKETHCTD